MSNKLSTWTYCVVLCTCLILNGCSPSTESAISSCESKSAEATFGLVALNQFQKNEIDGKERQAFWQCMKVSGFEENEAITNEYLPLVKSTDPNYTAEQTDAAVNKIRFQNMHLPSRGFWKRK